MAEVINLDEFRKRPVKVDELIDKAWESAFEDWKQHAKLNRLNEFFLSVTHVWSNPEINYLMDLQAVSRLEQRIGVSSFMEAPRGGSAGWVAGFHLKSSTFQTPELPDENYARCLSLVVFVRVRWSLISHGLVEELGA